MDRREYIILDIEVIATSKEHNCIRKLYAISKCGKKSIEQEFFPCVPYNYLDEKYKRAFHYCKKNIHKLSYYPRRNVSNLHCCDAAQIVKDFMSELQADLVFFKGGCLEKRLCIDVGVDSFDIAGLGLPKVNSHDPYTEVQEHYRNLQEYFHNLRLE